MKRGNRIIYTVVVFLWCFFITKNATAKTYAVVIGIARYQNPAVPALQYSDKDAGLFAAYLQSGAGGSISPNNIRLLQNDRATIAAVYNALDWLKEKCVKNDVAYIYFSGHGDVETKNAAQKGYLLAWNTPPNNYVNNAISIDHLNEAANTLNTRNGAKVILITDACHSGKLAGDFFKGKQLAARKLSQVLNNAVRLAACQANQEAAEGPDWGGGRGVFSYYLLSGLNGGADIQKDGNIQLWEISRFLDSALIADTYLQQEKHLQTPVSDGNPDFVLTSLPSGPGIQAAATAASSGLSAGLMDFDAVEIQPIDVFFSTVREIPLEKILDFTTYQNLPPDSLPLRIMGDCFEKWADLSDEILEAKGSWDMAALYDALKWLQTGLQKNQLLVSSFNEKLVQAVQDKAQEMINAYLTGDAAELEKRQYYGSGNWQYGQMLDMLHIALPLVPEKHYLKRVLAIDDSYLTGLIARLKMATATSTDSLLKEAFYYQQKAQQMEPYAAYINNELGNLFLHQKQYDSANARFHLASVLAPTWAIPWANEIRLNLAKNNLPTAKAAIRTADSLQPNLAFVLTNAGLVMEKDSNWLAAETDYLKAIQLNNVHYLPYERLGHMYLQTARYDEADFYLFQAKIRKEQYAVNDVYFEYGVEQGGLPPVDSPVKYHSCQPDFNMHNIRQAPYVQLLSTLLQQEQKTADAHSAVQAFRHLLQQVPTLPLAHHYLGRLLYQQGKWQQAIPVLVKAVAGYLPEKALKASFKKRLRSVKSSDTCLPDALACYAYDMLEDYYLLGALYEQGKPWNKAITTYTFISRIENERQKERAFYQGCVPGSPVDPNASSTRVLRGMPYHYAGPVQMGGVLKLTLLYEQLKDYKKAESIWLAQVAANQQMGRQSAFEAENPSERAGNGHLDDYWLVINRDAEAGTYAFYRRMMARFPRDFYWKEKAGLFLYQRLGLMFDPQVPEDYYTTHQGILSDAYPFVPEGKDPEEDSAVYRLPATGERLVIQMPVYDPVEKALQFLQQSIALSPDVLPRRPVAEALADVNAWYGNEGDAIQQYEALVKRQPADNALRQKIFLYLLANHELSAAYLQMDTLYQRKYLHPSYDLALAQYHAYSGKYREASLVLGKYQPETITEKLQKANLFATLNLLQGQPQNAIPYLLDAVWQRAAKAAEDRDAQQQQKVFRLYTLARLYAMQQQSHKSLAALQQSLDAGFMYKYVLDNDATWQNLKSGSEWQALISKYDFPNSYSTTKEKVSNYLAFRTPKK